MNETVNDEAIADKRRKRVKRIKIYIVVLFLILLIMPSILSIYAFKMISRMNAKVDELSTKVDQLEMTLLLKAEADAALEEAKITEAVEEEKELHLEYYQDDYEVPEDFRKVYLTFDDGPSIYTAQILDTLDTYGVKATFFVTGQQATSHPEWYQEIVGRGHTIGMHSYTHIYSDIYESAERFETDFNAIHDYLKVTTGVDCKYYRFPGGSSNTVSSINIMDLCKLLKEKGVTYYDWNISSQDASSPSLRSSEITQNVVAGIGKYNECMVLMHDAADKYSTVEALPGIIESILGMEKTVIVPINDKTTPIQHLTVKDEVEE